MRKILFVDDEPNVLQGLQRMLRPLRHEWEMAFAGSGEEALAALAARHFDVVVSDMRMPGMSGAQLLNEVLQRHPHVVRIILSGYADHDLVFKSVGPAHQFLSKPCDAETLKLTVNHTCALRDLLADRALQLLVSQMQTLPSLPALYNELVAELESPDVSVKRVGEIISQDLGMTAKILQMVNSAFFGLRRHIASPAEAVTLLGLETVMTLVMTIHIFSQFQPTGLPGFSPEMLYQHSLRVGVLAKQIVTAESADAVALNNAFSAGLLHDVGHLVLATNQPQRYAQMMELVRTESQPFDEAERQVFGATHSEVGAYLLGLWGLPSAIVESVAFHHRPSQSSAVGFTALGAVHVANVVEHELHPNCNLCCAIALDEAYLNNLGKLERLLLWRKLYSQTESGAAA